MQSVPEGSAWAAGSPLRNGLGSKGSVCHSHGDRDKGPGCNFQYYAVLCSVHEPGNKAGRYVAGEFSGHGTIILAARSFTITYMLNTCCQVGNAACPCCFSGESLRAYHPVFRTVAHEASSCFQDSRSGRIILFSGQSHRGRHPALRTVAQRAHHPVSLRPILVFS